MTKQMSAVLKGVAVGSAIGAATYMMAGQSKKQGRSIKKNAGRAMQAVGDMIENVACMMR